MSEAIGKTRQAAFAVDPIACEGCGVCVQVCPVRAIGFPERLCGEHDLKRVVQLARHFDIPLTVCINKWDLNPGMSDVIEAYCREHSMLVAGRIRYDRAFADAQIHIRTVVEGPDAAVAEDIRHLWNTVRVGFGALSPQEEPHHETSAS